ncbi:FAS1-like dehydratase domain-containing protein [Leekyejoonella antrihumi]|uniref:FAS1-like dehydratase domain-containing protein n=1 Tax=Leekyejoonella antrihumi TaxID=1660198 RepID=A0A563E8B6_9MICO|nr:MaoC family dehydratase N-terminal domain-containing protein [Leekyejoonella antrihumi]TWP38493.1 hypothetical protein FGL98_01450 [Leekyejoonella antrihumi]
MPITTEMIGRTGAPASEHVEDRWLMNYAAAVGDLTPHYYDNRGDTVLPGHPAYISHLEWEAISNLHEVLGELTAIERLQGVHSYNHTALSREVRSGDVLSSITSVVGVERRRSGARLTLKTVTTDVRDEVVAISHTATVFRGVPLNGDTLVPDAPVSQRPAAADRSSRSGTIQIGPLAPYVFSECARDYGIIHTDIEVATRAGLPGLILHGTGTIAYALSDIVNHELGGDPTAVAGFQASLRAMVMCPSTTRIEVFDDRPHGTVWFELLTEDGSRAISQGAVRVRPTSPPPAVARNRALT